MTIIAVVVLVAIVDVSKDLGSGLGPWPWACSSAAPWATSRTRLRPGARWQEGHVVDFLDYNGWFIGNVADIWIVGAALLIILLAVLGVGVDGRREEEAGTGRPEPREAWTHPR